MVYGAYIMKFLVEGSWVNKNCRSIKNRFGKLPNPLFHHKGCSYNKCVQCFSVGYRCYTYLSTTAPLIFEYQYCRDVTTPYLAANSWCASTSTFPITAFPWYSSLICQLLDLPYGKGPHQAAQKSTNTGLSLFKNYFFESSIGYLQSHSIVF